MGPTEFIDEVSRRLLSIQGRVLEHRHEGAGKPWWISFTRALFTYRINFEPRSRTVALQKGQGSFVPGSGMHWVVLTSHELPDDSLQSALEVLPFLFDRFPSRVAEARAAE